MFRSTARRLAAAAVTVAATAIVALVIAAAPAKSAHEHTLYRDHCPQNNPAAQHILYRNFCPLTKADAGAARRYGGWSH